MQPLCQVRHAPQSLLLALTLKQGHSGSTSACKTAIVLHMRSIAFSTISVLLFLFLGPLGFGANRGPREQTPHRPPSGGRVRIQVQTWGSSWDWNQDKGTLPTPVVAAVQRGLYRLDPQGMLEKDLVESENASDDFRTWTFKLKSQVFWSDGAPLTAQHCVDGILRALAPEVSKVPLELENLEGAMAYHLRETPLLPGVRALSERIFEVKLVRPDPLFRIKFLKHQLMPARGDLALTHAKSYGFEPEKMAFLGRMILKDSRPGLRTLMVPNPRHPHPSPISTIELWHVPNLFQARDLFERAHLDVALSPLPRVSSAKILRQSSTDLVALVPISTRAQNRLAMLAVLK
ncbi:MAG: ABC transporter substrate-binding protein, partial [Oligoflexia bacterium]